MGKEKLGNELSYARWGYKQERWKWASSLSPASVSFAKNGQESFKQNVIPSESLKELDLVKAYGFDKIPKVLPCQKKCQSNPWCLRNLMAGGRSSSRVPLTQQPRPLLSTPVGLQNTANTCWINSALQIFYNLRCFRNTINSAAGFIGDDSLSSLIHLLQVIFAEMEMHPFKAIACEPGSVFERLGLFASLEVMKKDANSGEVLKCVSEFIENTIDWLLMESSLASTVGPMFTITLSRIAKWQCSKCSVIHQYELTPASCYTMGAYISADQAPLAQCLMDLQAETQTGVVMVCGGGSGKGCGASVKVDRVVTPKLQTLPQYIIIRNNSLVAEDVKRRLHVVYPELLDLTKHTLNGEPAQYTLTGVIFHHGHWVKHYSAQVKTDGGPWYSFNDETVLEMNFKNTQQSQASPPENHPNYFSLGAVSSKYKSSKGERVSRGAFIWVYTLSQASQSTEVARVPPCSAVRDYIRELSAASLGEDRDELTKVQSQRQELLKRLSVKSTEEPYNLVSESVLHSWVTSERCKYVVQSHLAAELKCCHGNIKPLMAHAIKCVRQDKVSELLSVAYGIHSDAVSSLHLNGAHCSTPKEQTSSSTMNGSAAVVKSPDAPTEDRVSSSCTQDTDDSKTGVSSSDIQKSDVSTTSIPSLPDTTSHTKQTLKLETIQESCSSITSTSDRSKNTEAVKASAVMKPIVVVNGDSSFKSELKESVHNDGESVTPSYVESICGPQQLCRECVAVHVRFIVFLERLKEFHKLCKKESSKEPVNGISSCIIGVDTLELWPKIAVRKYLKDNEIDLDQSLASESDDQGKTTEDDATMEGQENNNRVDESLFNEDLVCDHHLLSPTANKCYLPESLYNIVIELCGEDVHPATVLDDFKSCTSCQNVVSATETECAKGVKEKTLLSSLFVEKKRPSHSKDKGTLVYLLDRDFYDLWKAYVRSCIKGSASARPALSNSDFFCKHQKLRYNPEDMESSRFTELFVVLWAEEWTTLVSLYAEPLGGTIRTVMAPIGFSSTQPDVCSEGCVESQAVYDYEDQFSYEREVIHVRQVNNAVDIPQRLAHTRAMGATGEATPSAVNGHDATAVDDEDIGEPKAKMMKLSHRSSERQVSRKKERSRDDAVSHDSPPVRLVRASKAFSSTDTIRQVQNFIAERTSVWPMLQHLWLCWSEDLCKVLGLSSCEGAQEPIQLQEEHLTMTLGALRIRPGDTIYFKAAKEDLEKAAGDGIIEYDELPT